MPVSTLSSRPAVWDTLLWSWRSPRLFAMALLAVAVILGAHYRFHRLDRGDMSSDEGASWAAASLSTLGEVVAEEQRLDSGKLALYDVTLHEWIRAFGDSLFALRAMSAVLGTIAMVLLFVAVREVCRLLGDESSAAIGELAGAFSALIYATNVVVVVSDRTARMYPMLVAAELLQITFFVRAQRRGASADYVGTAIFTATMIAINFTSSFLLFAEALWLGGLLVARWTGAGAGRLAIVRPGLAVAAGVALLAPLLPGMFADSEHAVRTGAIDWIKMQPMSWPFTILRDLAGPALFWISQPWPFSPCGGNGIRRVWSWGFWFSWMVGPLIAAFAVTYLIRPMEFPRYVLIAFLGMFAFAGFGAAAVRGTALRIAFAILIVHLSVPQVRDRLRNFHELGWREAAVLAMRETAPGDRIAVYLYQKCRRGPLLSALRSLCRCGRHGRRMRQCARADHPRPRTSFGPKRAGGAYVLSSYFRACARNPGAHALTLDLRNVVASVRLRLAMSLAAFSLRYLVRKAAAKLSSA